MITDRDTEIPEIAIVRSSRGWARTLHRYVVDHGGAVVKARPLEERQALEEEYDILVVDDISSFLTHHIVDELHRRGRRVLGVYDPDEFSPGEENNGKLHLIRMGADGSIEAQAAPEEFVRAIEELAPAPVERARHFDLTDDLLDVSSLEQAAHAQINVPVTPGRASMPANNRRGHITAVLGASGGCGVTEITIELGHQLAKRGEKTIIVDGDELSPSLAQRLNLPLHPNLRTAVDVVEHGTGRLSECLVGIGSNLEVLTGLPHPKDWVEMRASDMEGLLGELSRGRPQLVVNASPLIEDLTTFGGADRFGISRAVVSTADTLVVVCPPTPMGVARLLDRVADLSELADGKPVHVVVSRAQKGTFKRNEIAREIQRSIASNSVHFLPNDAHVEHAAWEGTLVTNGEFTKAVTALAPLIPKAVMSAARPPRRSGKANK
jgi:MinD-like ATPase involved in chromosome partitioning or flagellar assembly